MGTRRSANALQSVAFRAVRCRLPPVRFRLDKAEVVGSSPTSPISVLPGFRVFGHLIECYAEPATDGRADPAVYAPAVAWRLSSAEVICAFSARPALGPR
jgi:hypothetical protein